jgi:hypothetical protein
LVLSSVPSNGWRMENPPAQTSGANSRIRDCPMTLVDLMRRLFARAAPQRPACHLTETQALEIARGVVSAACWVHVVRTEKGIEWQISTATKGSGDLIRIDDATGKIIERRRWGIR